MKCLFWLTIPCLTLLVACEEKPKTQINTKVVGADSDSHGCKGSAGYQWSELRGDCVRVWEAGVAMISTEDSTKAGYAIFAADSSQVELFLPNTDGKSQILDRRKASTGDAVWNVEDDDTYNLMRSKDGKWELEKREKIVFKER